MTSIKPIPLVFDIENLVIDNNNFREVLFTNDHSQVVIMSISPGENIGSEVHTTDQIIFILEGSGIAVVNGININISDGFVINIPKGNKHDIINTGQKSMKLYTVYSPPNEPPGLIQKNKL